MPAEAVIEERDATEHDRSVATPEKPKRMPRYVVIVENDEHHTFPYVIDILRKVCGHDRQRAYQLTNQVHFRGQAGVWVGALEHAELKRDLIRGYGPDVYARDPVAFPLGTRLELLTDE
ncbi:MAG: ATP-dependent Clp protease adaptor ClpS [Planctomycetota bacterium]|nr:ATP-dependent Clp protease adaptor ClpS [Planctomycetota bacterium]